MGNRGHGDLAEGADCASLTAYASSGDEGKAVRLWQLDEDGCIGPSAVTRYILERTEPDGSIRYAAQFPIAAVAYPPRDVSLRPGDNELTLELR
jgi:hypothetical protein